MKTNLKTNTPLFRLFLWASALLIFSLFTAGAAQGANRATTSSGYAQMVLDILPGVDSSQPHHLFAVNGIAYFAAHTDAYGSELWRSDGTAAGTYMVADIVPGPGSSGIYSIVAFDGYFNDSVIYFLAYDGSSYQIWKSDGTAAGTVQASAPLLNPGGLTVVGDTLFFAADDPTYGRELWSNNGTYGGSMLVKDIYPGAQGSSPYNMTHLGNTLLFIASNNTYGYELWRSDGTTAGTMLVKDIASGANHGVGGRLVPFGNKVYFAGEDTANNRELWQTDGTADGTTLVIDLAPGDSNPTQLTVAGGRLFFITYYDGKLWASDGTASGTQLVGALPPYSYNQVTAYDNLMCLNVSGFDGTNTIRQLWCSDGLTVWEVELATNGYALISILGVSGNSLFLWADDYVHGEELWKTDGTSAGSAMIQDINPGSDSSSPQYLVDIGGRAVFTADDGQHGIELWLYDLAAQPPAPMHQIYLPAILR